MHTGRWWWDTQVCRTPEFSELCSCFYLPQKEIEKRKPGATIIPIIISSDKTQLTVFGNKSAYPVYMTIGNLPKDVRRKPSRPGQILLAYLPSSRLEHITSKTVRRRVIANLFHVCMSTILKPLIKAGIHGIKVMSGDGVDRRGHPIFTVHVGDYPEQLLVACCKNGTCPKCDIPRDEIGDSADFQRPLRNLDDVLDALGEVNTSATAFSRACREAGIKPVCHPFWESLPYVNVFRSITPDILHQLHQGVIRHLIGWLKKAYGDGLVACSRPGLRFRAPEQHIVVLEDYKSLVRPANRDPLSPESHVILRVFCSSVLRADWFARSLATRPSSQGPRLRSPVLTSAFPTLAATRYVLVQQLATCSLHYRVRFSGPAL